VLSVQPEKVSLMQSFGNPPGGPEDEAKVEMLIKAAKVSFDQPILFSANPAHKDFLQKQADKLGVKFADTPEEFARLKAERDAQAGLKIGPKMPDTTLPQQLQPTSDVKPVRHERTAAVPSVPQPPLRQNEDPVKRMEAMVDRIMKVIDNPQDPIKYKSQTDESGNNALISKADKPVLSVQPEKVSLMQPFGNPPGGPEDEAKVAMLVKSAKAVFDQPILFSTNPAHKDFLQKQADKLGVKFAATPEEFARLKAERDAQLGPKIEASTTPTQQKFGGIGVDEQTLQKLQTPETPDTTLTQPKPPKSDFENAVDALQSNDKKEYMREILEDNNTFFKIEELEHGAVSIKIRDDSTLTNDQAKELTTKLAGAVREILPLAQLDTGSEQKNIILNANYLQSLKEDVGIDTSPQHKV